MFKALNVWFIFRKWLVYNLGHDILRICNLHILCTGNAFVSWILELEIYIEAFEGKQT